MHRPSGAVAGARMLAAGTGGDGWTAAAVGLGAAAVAAAARMVQPQVYLWGDNSESFVPLWHHLGTRLRAGEWLSMDPAGWMGGNYAAEAAYGIYNPVTMATAAAISTTDDLSVAALGLAVEFLGLLAAALYLLARGYGARRAPSVAVAMATPFGGFTYFYGAGNWASGLMALTWVVWFWWAARRHSAQGGSPLPAFVLGVLAVTTGNPYAVLGVLLVLGALAAELVLAHRPARLASLVLLGACVGAAVALTYLPTLAVLDTSWRSGAAGVENDGYLVPDLGDLAAMSSPTYLPSMQAWELDRDVVPSTYFAWFALPLLPWLRWAALARVARRTASLHVLSGTALLLTLAPSSLWLFRWPLRLVEHLYVGVGTTLALLLSFGLARTRVRLRASLSVGAVLIGTYLAWAGTPEDGGLHLFAAGIVLALVALGWCLHRVRGLPGLCAVMVAGTCLVLPLQVSSFWWTEQSDLFARPLNVGTPHDLAAVRASTAGYRGTVLQLADPARNLSAADLTSGRLLFGNAPAPLGREWVNRYSGVGHDDFHRAACMDYRGATCPLARDRLLNDRRHAETVSAPLVDLLGVGTLVLQDNYFSDRQLRNPPEGWRVLRSRGTTTVFVRDEPLPTGTRLTHLSQGAAATALETSPHREEVRYSASPGGATAVFARLHWPGYSATVDGRALPVRGLVNGLVALDLPAGEHTVVLEYRTPGQAAGAGWLLAAALVAVAHAAAWRRRSRQDGRGPAALTPAPLRGPARPPGARG